MKKKLKVYACSYQGYWIEGISVVVATNKKQATELMKEVLRAKGLRTDDIELKKVNMHEPGVHMLSDGDH